LKVLGIVGNNLRGLEQTGQLSRFTEYYWRYYAEQFDKMFVFSERCQASTPDYAGKCIVVEPYWHISSLVYQFMSPFVHREFRACNLLRVMHMTGTIPAVIARLLWGIPFVATYGYDYARYVWMGQKAKVLLWLKYLYVRSVVSLGIRFALRIIVTAPEALEELGSKGLSAKIVYAPNGVDTSLFRSVDHVGSDARVLRCVFLGRFEPQKNLFQLIDGLALLHDIPLRMTLIGDGSLREKIRSYADKQGVELHMEGVRPHSELPELLSQHQVFVLPSLEEGHPKALLEAMSCGLACVGSKVRGISTLIRDNETGILCDLDPVAFAEALRKLHCDISLRKRLGEQARKYVQENFDLSVLLRKEAVFLSECV
jgi:glycosyltransferase involved in cell wall biosynthesis